MLIRSIAMGAEAGTRPRTNSAGRNDIRCMERSIAQCDRRVSTPIRRSPAVRYLARRWADSLDAARQHAMRGTSERHSDIPGASGQIADGLVIRWRAADGAVGRAQLPEPAKAAPRRQPAGERPPRWNAPCSRAIQPEEVEMSHGRWKTVCGRAPAALVA